jgi:hypothetical protein
MTKFEYPQPSDIRQENSRDERRKMEPETELHLILSLQVVSFALILFGFIKLNRKAKRIMTDLTQLTADVSAITTEVDSAIALLNGLKAALDAAGTDPVALKALSQALEDKTAALAAALVANTPSAPTT